MARKFKEDCQLNGRVIIANSTRRNMDKVGENDTASIVEAIEAASVSVWNLGACYPAFVDLDLDTWTLLPESKAQSTEYMDGIWYPSI